METSPRFYTAYMYIMYMAGLKDFLYTEKYKNVIIATVGNLLHVKQKFYLKLPCRSKR